MLHWEREPFSISYTITSSRMPSLLPWLGQRPPLGSPNPVLHILGHIVCGLISPHTGPQVHGGTAGALSVCHGCVPCIRPDMEQVLRGNMQGSGVRSMQAPWIIVGHIVQAHSWTNTTPRVPGDKFTHCNPGHPLPSSSGSCLYTYLLGLDSGRHPLHSHSHFHLPQESKQPRFWAKRKDCMECA